MVGNYKPVRLSLCVLIPCRENVGWQKLLWPMCQGVKNTMFSHNEVVAGPNVDIDLYCGGHAQTSLVFPCRGAFISPLSHIHLPTPPNT